MNNGNGKRSDNARRRPSGTTGTTGTRVVGGTRSGTRAVTGVKKSDPRKEQRALEKSEKKRAAVERRAQSNERWQADIVRVRGGVDGGMLALILVLLALGSITVFSASYPEAVRKTGDGMTYIRSQILNVILGLIVMIGVSHIPLELYRRWLPAVVYGTALVLLIVVLFYGTAVGVTKRWLSVGPINIQPSEIMKLGVILMLARYFEKYDDKVHDRGLSRGKSYCYNVLYPLAILGLACILVLLGKHLSGTIIVGLIGCFVLVVSGCDLLKLISTGGPIGIVVVLWYLKENPYALKRFTTYTDANADKLSDLYQTTQGIYAIGSGGLFGVGLGESRQKFSYLSAAHTDFIFAIWCEEWGFIGAVVLIVLFLLFIWRGYVIALRAPDRFTMMCAFGITTHVGLQAFLNMFVVSAILPNTGVTLPFFSYGGSSLLIVMFEMGMLLSISRQYYRKRSDLRKVSAEVG